MNNPIRFTVNLVEGSSLNNVNFSKYSKFNLWALNSNGRKNLIYQGITDLIRIRPEIYVRMIVDNTSTVGSYDYNTKVEFTSNNVLKIVNLKMMVHRNLTNHGIPFLPPAGFRINMIEFYD